MRPLGLRCLTVLILLLAACDSGEVEKPIEPLPDGLALFASVGRQPAGFWAFDANTLEKVDSLDMQGESPSAVAFSDGYATWHWVRAFPPDDKKLFAYDVATRQTRFVPTEGLAVVAARGGSVLVAYGNPITQFYDARTLDLVHEDSLGFLSRVAVSPEGDHLYALQQDYEEPGVRGVLVYDLKSHAVERVIPLSPDEDRRSSMAPAAIAVSPDGGSVYASVFNWRGGGGYGSFHDVDLRRGRVVVEHPCGSFAQLGVAPDGRSVYLSDPAGYFYEMIPTDQILRYRPHSRRIEVFADGSRSIGLTGGRLVSWDVVVAPDSRTLFVGLQGSAETVDGKRVDVLKLDAVNKEVLGVFEIPPDEQGRITTLIAYLRLGMHTPEE